MKYRSIIKHVFPILIFLGLLITIRLLWLGALDINNSYEAKEGKISFSEELLDVDQAIALKGKWRYYPDQLTVAREQLEESPTEMDYQSFPEHWINRKSGSFHYATYQLEIDLEEDSVNQLYSIHMPRMPTAAKVYVNGELMREVGNVTSNPEVFQSKTLPVVIPFYVDQSPVTITVQVSHNEIPIQFNTAPIMFGKADIINKYIDSAKYSKFSVLVLFGLLALLSFIIYFIRFKDKILVYFFFLFVSAALMILFDEDTVLFLDLSLNYADSLRIRITVYTCISIFLLLFSKELLPDYALNRLVTVHTILFSLYILFVIITPEYVFVPFTSVLSYILLSTVSILIIQFIRAILDKVNDMLYLIFCTIVVSSNILWANLKYNSELFFDFYPFDLIITITCFIIFWMKRFFRYVIETERLTKELQKSMKSKDDFFANTSHELRSPLHSIINIADYVLHNKNNKITQSDQKDMQLLLTVGKRMSLLIDDLLDLSQIREKNIKLVKNNISLQPLISSVIKMVEYLTEGKNIRIINYVPSDLIIISGDENRIIQILLNILHNAVKFTEKGTVTVETEIVDGYVKVIVTDQGRGIDNKSLQRIFQPYEQAEDNANGITGGIGLGLTITRELIRLHGGDIHLSSIIGEGTVVSFTLPLGEKQVIAQETDLSIVSNNNSDIHAVAKKKNYSARILVVDDEKINYEVISRILINENYQLFYANNGREALEFLHNNQVHLVISDVMMPQMTGYQLAEEIRRKYDLSELPILLLTARAKSADLEIGFKVGANDYLVKPVDPLELKARVKVLAELKNAVTNQLKLEAAWLRAQINPHFLFNTINSILALNDEDPDKMEEVLESFIYYLQTSFDFQNLNEVVPIALEIDLVKAYLLIEKVRFVDKINVVWKIQEDIPVQVPPLSIQTIVENAINHGILKKADGGTVVIEAEKNEKDVTILIKDNGNGMPNEVIQMIKEQQPDQRYGIGLLNTDKRLRQFFGSGLVITTSRNAGTTISFSVPYTKD
ncbi:hybrid sensor histidine kinase/response regulator [Gracilibacillus oryzae]|uniref:hybrid sensor histidine kinase/response regulator n=1 Tax=Gracilibacillus oryzae TaxID=1672701 RepID=UPI001885B341|nr:ATP-binding protein [Gracilibacillus oryzae]